MLTISNYEALLKQADKLLDSAIKQDNFRRVVELIAYKMILQQDLIVLLKAGDLFLPKTIEELEVYETLRKVG